MQGIVRKPALLYGNHLSLEDINSYEVAPSEPLHDLKGHISNIWVLLPEVLSKENEEIFKDILKCTFGGKDKVKGCDYRLSAITVYNKMKTLCSQKIVTMLRTLVSVTKLAYLPADKRSPRIILLTYNTTFIHAVSVLDVFGKNPNSTKITNNKLYGMYSHSIFAHFPSLQRIIPLSSIHCESEERNFTSINRISKNTSSRKLDHIRDNSIIRIQCELIVKNETPSL